MIFFILAYLIWVVTTPVVATILALCGEKVVMLFDGHDITQALTSSGKTIILAYSPSPDGKPHTFNYRNISYGTVFLLALIMAVPDVRPKLRVKILLLGLAFLLPVQLTRLVVHVFDYYGQHMQMDGVSLYPVVYRKGLFFANRVLTRIDGQVIPVVIWAALYFYYVWYNKFFRKRTKPARG
ncbi:MAG: hypothetical protein U9R56_05710 [candidate division Zixibacteria bacterium]|nr:hypothetical protein [candidate division Zixibacteria bacterium]